MAAGSTLGYRAFRAGWFLTLLLVAVAASPWGGRVFAATATVQSTITPAAQKDWMTFLRRYMGPDGRIIDTANGGISHTEGQGYGMLLATYFNDRPDFELMRNWTETTLRHSSDHLHAWVFRPYDAQPLADDNNATDGDLYIAWALLRAGKEWHNRSYTEAGTAIARDILITCVVDYHGMKLLLPGAKGFERGDDYVINLSYYAINALRAMSRAVPDPAWAKLEADGLTLMRAARFGTWRLPPDWLLVTSNGGIRAADGWPARFSWDALRIPLHLAWAGLKAPLLRSTVGFWTSPTFAVHPPAWVDLKTNETPSYAGHAGIKAVLQLAQAKLNLDVAQAMPTVAQAPDYYGAALVLLSEVAMSEQPEAPATVPIDEGSTASANDPATPPVSTGSTVSSMIGRLFGGNG